MDRPCDEFLAGAGLARHEYIGVEIGDLLDQSTHVTDRVGVARDAMPPLPPVVTLGAAEQARQLRALQRQLERPVRAVADKAVIREANERQSRVLFPDPGCGLIDSVVVVTVDDDGREFVGVGQLCRRRANDRLVVEEFQSVAELRRMPAVSTEYQNLRAAIIAGCHGCSLLV